MADNNKRNILYFEAASMAQLFDQMQVWQVENEKRFLSVSIEKEGDKFCCIGLTNPSEVVIVAASRSSSGYQPILRSGDALMVTVV